MEGESSNKSPTTEAVIEALKPRGWCLGDIDQLNALVLIHSALSDDGDTFTIANSIESELLNMDLRSIGAKSLPDPNLLSKTSLLHGPKILQVNSVRDISVGNIDGFKDSNNRRLLRFILTDGHNEITAIEYSRIPSISNDDVVPGTKVRLENKVPVHSCIVCLNPNVVKVIGGTVQSLYDEWQMNKKYSGFSRSSLRLSKEIDSCGPPAFEKLQIGAPFRRSAQRGRVSDYFNSTSKNAIQITARTSGNTKVQPLDTQRTADDNDDKEKIVPPKASVKEKPISSQWRSKEDCYEAASNSNAPTPANKSGTTERRAMSIQQEADVDYSIPVFGVESLEEKPSTSAARLKEVVESVPVQNQSASQKLLHKMNHPNQGDRHPRGQKYRGKDKQDESQVLTLYEWEKNNAGARHLTKNELPDTSCDEDLAWQLQNQLDMEKSHGHSSLQKHSTVADDIRMSMFNYDRDGGGFHDHGGRGRGRGRGRGGGRERWRGKGRGRGRVS